MAGVHFSTRSTDDGEGVPHLEEFRVEFEIGDETGKNYVDGTSKTMVGTVCGGGDKPKAGDDKPKTGDDKPEAGSDTT